MSRMPKEYFEEMYARERDPWGFATRWYESRKYDLTLASLPRERYRSAFEPGCSIGVLTARLARRCARVLAGDEILSAVEQARSHTEALAHVEIRPLTLPDDWPDATFDLIVLSEVAYYFDEHELGEVIRRCLGSLEPGGTLLAVHWRGPTNYPLSGDRTHQLIGARPDLAGLVHHVEEEFVLDVWERLPA